MYRWTVRAVAWACAVAAVLMAALSVAPLPGAIFLAPLLLLLAAATAWHGSPVPGAVTASFCLLGLYFSPMTWDDLSRQPVFAAALALGFAAVAWSWPLRAAGRLCRAQGSRRASFMAPRVGEHVWSEEENMVKKRERSGGRLARGLKLVSAGAVAIVVAWYLANTIDSGLQPWGPGLDPDAAGPVKGARHDGWMALVGLQEGHLQDPLAHGTKTWAAWDAGRQRMLALDEAAQVFSVPTPLQVPSDSPVSCRPLHRCGELLRERQPMLPEALRALAPMVAACEGIGRQSGFDEPLVRVPVALSRPSPAMALGTCGRLWMAQMLVSTRQRDEAAAFKAWITVHRVAKGAFEGAQSTVSGVSAATLLALVHAQGPALVAAFPALHDQVRAALAAPVPWREASRRWWIDEGWSQDRLLYEALDAAVNTDCQPSGPGMQACQITRTGHVPPRLRPVLPNLTRSGFRAQHAAVLAAADSADPAVGLQGLEALIEDSQPGRELPRLRLRNTLGGILVSVSGLEGMVYKYLRHPLDAELTRQGALLWLDALSPGRQGAPLSEATLSAKAGGSVVLKGRVRCEDSCRRIVLRSWRAEPDAPQWRLPPGP